MVYVFYDFDAELYEQQENKIGESIASLSVSRRVSGHSCGVLIADIEGVELTGVDKDVLRHPQLGGLIFFSRNYESPEQMRDLVRCIREVRPELVLSVDHEGGRVQRFREGFTLIPPMAKLGHLAARDRVSAQQVAEDIAWLMAYELLELDIDHSYAPVLDLDVDFCQVIGDRAFSNDIELVNILAESFIKGMRQAGMQATAKHFPGHGGVEADSHLELPIDPRCYKEIYERDIQPFLSLMPSYAALMTAHIEFSQVDCAPVSFSRKWIREILRETLKFEGLVLSDDLSMKGAEGSGSFFERAQKALYAGCNAVLLCNRRKEAERVLEALEREYSGRLSGLEGLRRATAETVKSDATKKNERARILRVRKCIDELDESLS